VKTDKLIQFLTKHTVPIVIQKSFAHEWMHDIAIGQHGQRKVSALHAFLEIELIIFGIIIDKTKLKLIFPFALNFHIGPKLYLFFSGVIHDLSVK